MTPSNLRTAGALAVTTLLASTAPAIAQLPITLSRVPYWEQLGPLPGAGPVVTRLVSSAADTDRIYATSRAGVLASFDRGLSWELRSRHSPGYGSLYNHNAEDPNAYAKRDEVKGVIGIWALKRIEKDEEITLCYGEGYEFS